MRGISRRQFLRDASLGAAAVGTVAVVGPSAFGLVPASSAGASPVGYNNLAGDATPLASRSRGDEVMAHVVDEPSGTITLYSGTRKVTFQDRAVAGALLKALG
ncbi:MAG TPA: twin-arginine translocation signal domain-containing protein [Acidimicrobiales bacterium]|nr:twin-arginine translocation signal domain-containing protein [Acidimicrobiales bacterium]